MNIEEKCLIQQAVQQAITHSTYRYSLKKGLLLILVIVLYTCSFFPNEIKETFCGKCLDPLTPKSVYKSEVCIFPKVDFFHPEIMKFYKRPTACKGKPLNVTILQNRKLLIIQPEKYDCWGRCHTFKNGNETFEGKWFSANKSYSFPCDVVEARCSIKHQDIKDASYYFMHTQVLEVPPRKQKFTVKGKQYDVYFIVVDSQAHTQMFRNLNKTNHFLLKEMEAVAFPHLNRIGSGSNPNGMAWFYGKITERVDRSSYNMPSLEPDAEWKTYCKRKLDNETMIINEFGDHGYMTSHVADWWRTVDYGCVGTDDQFADHTYTPYAMYYEYNRKMIQSMSKKQCIHRHQHALEYLGQFVDSYRGKPKMAFVWLSHVGHNTERGSMDADQHLLDLFKNHKDSFDKSFVFITGDHGLRHTNAIKTKVGALDINNPALYITVPKELRKNTDLMVTLKANARELQTHYDTRATLLDILKFQPSTNYSDRSHMPIKAELGSSFLRPQPKPRTCQTLPIPPIYCICENLMAEDVLKKDPTHANKIGNQAVDLINRQLFNSTDVHKCRTWVFKKTQKLLQISKAPSLNYEGLVSVTNDRKLQAEFKIFFGGQTESSFSIISLARVDSYNNAGHCVIISLQPICDCY